MRLRAEAGASLSEILQRIVPHGWFLSTSPGTRFVTLGGAVANDVHGKNHHGAGTFGALLGLMGAGGVTSGLLLPQFRRHLSRGFQQTTSRRWRSGGWRIIISGPPILPAWKTISRRRPITKTSGRTQRGKRRRCFIQRS